MTRVFIETSCGVISEHYDFEIVPRTGELIFIQNADGEVKLMVQLVEHYPSSRHGVTNAAAPITIQCEVQAH